MIDRYDEIKGYVTREEYTQWLNSIYNRDEYEELSRVEFLFLVPDRVKAYATRGAFVNRIEEMLKELYSGNLLATRVQKTHYWLKSKENS